MFTMPEFVTIKAEDIQYGNNFIEVSRKKVDDNEFLMVSKGYFAPDGSKRYKGGVGIPDRDEVKKFIAEKIGQM